MSFEELLQFISVENSRLTKKYAVTDQAASILGRTVKITEELGELCSAVLAHLSLQRESKLDKHSKENLDEEFSDVLITTLLLAHTMDVDIQSALRKKIAKINQRYDILP